MKLFWLALFVACSAAASQPLQFVHVSKEVDYVVPADSPVKFQSIGKYDTVTYAGQFLLTGRYTYGFVPDNPEEGVQNQLELTFTLSKHDAGKLPYWIRDRPIREIDIRNPDQFARKVIGQENLARLKAKKILQVSGIATIEVRGLQTTIECDHQSTSVEFVARHRTEVRKVAMLRLEESGC